MGQTLNAITQKNVKILHSLYQGRIQVTFWLAYTEFQGGFNMLQLISVDFGHFTQPHN